MICIIYKTFSCTKSASRIFFLPSVLIFVHAQNVVWAHRISWYIFIVKQVPQSSRGYASEIYWLFSTDNLWCSDGAVKIACSRYRDRAERSMKLNRSLVSCYVSYRNLVSLLSYSIRNNCVFKNKHIENTQRVKIDCQQWQIGWLSIYIFLVLFRRFRMNVISITHDVIHQRYMHISFESTIKLCA